MAPPQRSPQITLDQTREEERLGARLPEWQNEEQQGVCTDRRRRREKMSWSCNLLRSAGSAAFWAADGVLKASRFASRRSAPMLVVLCLLLPALACSSAVLNPPPAALEKTVSEIRITATPLRKIVKRFGINLAGQSFYDSGQMLRDLVFRNPGFEGETWQSLLRCKTASPTTCTDENPYTVWPTDFLKGATFEFLSGNAAGLKGSIEGSLASRPPEKGISFAFQPLTHAPSAGDIVAVRFFRPGGAEQGWWTNEMQGGAKLETEFHDLAPDSPGKQALRMLALSPGQDARIDSYFDTYPGRSFLQLKGSYTLSFRAKGLGGNSVLRVGVARYGATQEQLFPLRSIPLSGAWKNYRYDWTASEDGTARGPVDLSFAVAGGAILLDDVSLTSAAAQASNPTVFRDEVVAALRELHPGLIRYTDTATAPGSTIDNMLAPPFARERAGYSTQSAEQDQVPLGLGEFLALCKTLQAEPWYALPATTTPEEMSNLMEYLGGTSATRYGARRAALGQPEPWTDVFPVIHLEYGNELWNAGTFYGASISDPVLYGRRAAQLFNAAHRSPWFRTDRFDLVLGSLAANPWWTSQELAHSEDYASVAVAPYLFDKLDRGVSTEAIFESMFAEAEHTDRASDGLMVQQAAAVRASGHAASLGVYEVNLGTDQGDAPQTLVDAVVPSLGGGLAVMDHMLLMLRDLGIRNQATFSLPGFANKFRNPAGKAELTPLWGMVVDMGGATNRRRPLFLAEQLTNRVMLATMLEASVGGPDPVVAQSSSPNRIGASPAFHTLQLFAFGQGTRRSLIVFNLDQHEPRPVTFSGDRPRGQVHMTQLTAPHITDTNEQEEAVRMTHSELQDFHASRAYSLAPFSMTVFEWTSTQTVPE